MPPRAAHRLSRSLLPMPPAARLPYACGGTYQIIPLKARPDDAFEAPAVITCRHDLDDDPADAGGGAGGGGGGGAVVSADAAVDPRAARDGGGLFARQLARAGGCRAVGVGRSAAAGRAGERHRRADAAA